jgi:hypothetical protein
VNESNERAGGNFIIRPLDAEIMEANKIEEPPYSLHDCLACREGQVYKSTAEASAHLKRVHFPGKHDLLLLVNLERTLRYA